MEPILGLLGSGGGGGGGGIGRLSEKTALNASKMEKGYMGIQKEAELELGLCLSLGGGGGGCGSGGVKGKGSAAAWGEYGRILTAKDFPNGFCAGTKRERAAADSDVEAGTAASTGVSQVVGWPPIRAYRMNTLVNQVKNSNMEDDKGVGGNQKTENSKKKINHGSNKNDTCTKERIHPRFVKVNMDGMQIGRKVDLNAHMSYETLAKTLEDMFFNPALNINGGNDQTIQQSPKLLDATSEFALTYEDKEGDWMLVGDVPWGMFMNTLKRLKIMRTSDANGLAPKFQESNEKQKGRQYKR